MVLRKKFIIEYLKVEGYPTAVRMGLKQASVSDLVLCTIVPILSAFKDKVCRDIQLKRGKETTSTDNEIGGYSEFVVIDRIFRLRRTSLC